MGMISLLAVDDVLGILDTFIVPLHLFVVTVF